VPEEAIFTTTAPGCVERDSAGAANPSAREAEGGGIAGAGASGGHERWLGGGAEGADAPIAASRQDILQVKAFVSAAAV